MTTLKSILTLAVLALIPATATAQLDLPDEGDRPRRVQTQPDRGRGDLAPHLVCTVCGTRSYTASRTRPVPEEGLYLAVCTHCRGERKHREGGRTAGGDLDLPKREETPPSDPESSPSKPAIPEVPLLPAALSAQARFILEEIAKSDSPSEVLQAQAIQRLSNMGDEGVIAARVALYDDRAALVELGARALLGSGRGSEIERVATRLRDSLPGRLGPVLLDALVEADPVYASPQLLCALLEHSHGAMRQTASRHLNAHLGPELLAPLREVLNSKRTSTRVAAIGLVARIDDLRSRDLLLEHLADSSPTVCDRVLSQLTSFEDDTLDVELLRRAFSKRWILRPSAYALLAVMDREDISRRGILDERHAPSLLSGLDSRDPFVSGTCAAALAGIGFRSEDVEATRWLDDLIPAHLVIAVSGSTFHTDYASLQPRALRRLEFIAGERIGTDGRKWVDWWTSSRGSFQALRAPFPISLNEVSRLVVRHRSSAGVFALAGFDAPPPSGPEERFVLGASQMAALVDSMRELGVLSAERLPGARGNRSASERELSLRVLGREKVFLFGDGKEEEWFAMAVALLTEQRERQRWQRFVPPPGADKGPWEAEALWWGTEQVEKSRAVRMKRLVLTHLKVVPPSQRLLGLAELEWVLAMEGVGSIADVAAVLDFIDEEAFYTDRTRRMVNLARGLIRGNSETAIHTRERLIGVLMDRFGDAGAESVAAVLTDLASEELMSLGADERPLVRALVAVHLSGTERREERALLLALMDDEDSSVEAAAITSLGHARLEGARTELLLRARFAEGVVRQAALEASGRLGGDGVRQALVTGLAERDAGVQLAALRGLAHLDDPQSISLFISYLQQAPDSEMFTVALEALAEFGQVAQKDLLRVANSKLHKARGPAAMILAREGVGAAADSLVALLEASPDFEVAHELAVLTCFDLRAAKAPAAEYAAWLRTQGHRDAWTWFVEATARRELVCPAREAFEGKGTRDAALFLLEVVAKSEMFLAERARRELGRMLGVDLVALFNRGVGRDTWVQAAQELIDRTYPAPGGGE